MPRPQTVMPHYHGEKSSALSPEHKLRRKASAKIHDARLCLEALLTQSNDDENETKFHFAKLRRRLKALREVAARMAVFPDHEVKGDDGHGNVTTHQCSPLARAKEILDVVEDIEAKSRVFFDRFFELPMDHAFGVKEYGGSQPV